mmetsp:Transcript_139631/g.446790  ORF Transcript_139631/g.446790 Transcript_139631/m.446790 type:complete len:200 (-) Transcript_139631:428-1027(-)
MILFDIDAVNTGLHTHDPLVSIILLLPTVDQGVQDDMVLGRPREARAMAAADGLEVRGRGEAPAAVLHVAAAPALLAPIQEVCGVGRPIGLPAIHLLRVGARGSGEAHVDALRRETTQGHRRQLRLPQWVQILDGVYGMQAPLCHLVGEARRQPRRGVRHPALVEVREVHHDGRVRAPAERVEQPRQRYAKIARLRPPN